MSPRLPAKLFGEPDPVIAGVRQVKDLVISGRFDDGPRAADDFYAQGRAIAEKAQPGQTVTLAWQVSEDEEVVIDATVTAQTRRKRFT